MLSQALNATGWTKKIVSRDETDRLPRADLARDGARDDVDFVETGRGNQQVRALDLRTAQDLGVGSAPVQELDVEVGQPLATRGVGVDDEDIVLGGEGLRQRVPDLTRADDDDPHLISGN